MSPAIAARSGRDGILGSVTNAARVLKEFAYGGRERGVTELSHRLGLGKSTVHRVLTTFVAEGVLERNAATGGYRLTSTLRDLEAGTAARTSLAIAATAFIEQFAHVAGQSAFRGNLSDEGGTFVVTHAGPGTLQQLAEAGLRPPGSGTEPGLLLLAYIPDR